MSKSIVRKLLSVVGVNVFVRFYPEADCTYAFEVGYDIVVELGAHLNMEIEIRPLGSFHNFVTIYSHRS